MSDFQSEMIPLLNKHFGNNWKKISVVANKRPPLEFTYEVVE